MISTPVSTERTVSLGAVAWFFIAAYALAWSLWFVLAALADATGLPTADFVEAIEQGDVAGTGSGAPAWLLYLMTRAIDFSFTITGLAVIAVTAERSGLRTLGRRLLRWRIPGRWYALALAPVVFYGVAAVVTNRQESGSVEFTSGTISTLLFSWSAGLLVSLFLRGAMGEELGLRGFAIPALQQHLSPAAAALVVGVAWAGWHAPILATRSAGTAVLQAVVIVGLSFVFTWLFNGSGGSLIPPLLFHATQNWEEAFEEMFPAIAGTDWETLVALALLVLIVVSVIAVVRSNSSVRSLL